MRAYFSDTDNRDETGFRIYGVMGEIFSNPQIRMRVGIYGHFYETATTDSSTFVYTRVGLNAYSGLPFKFKVIADNRQGSS